MVKYLVKKVLLNILNLCDKRPNIGAFTMSPTMSHVIYAEKFRVFTTTFLSVFDYYQNLYWRSIRINLTLLMAQWVDMEAEKITHWAHVGAWPPYLRLFQDYWFVGPHLESQKSTKETRDFFNASMSAHWAIRRVIDLSALPLFAILQ